MADSNTTRLGLLKMEIDSHENDWGVQLNVNFDEIDEAVAAQTTHVTTGGTTTLNIDTQRPPFHRVTGALVSNATFEVPAAAPKLFFWKNETTGNFTVTVKVNGQTGVVVPRGETVLLRNNGTDVLNAGVGQGAASGLANWVGTLGFAADAYTAAAIPQVPATLVDGLTIRGFIDDTNTTTTPNLNYGASGAKTIVHRDGTALAVGDLVDGMIGDFTYKAATDNWYVSPVGASRMALLNRANTFAIDKDQTFNGRALGALETLTDAATIAWDMADRPNDVKIVLTASRTLGAATNLVENQRGRLIVMQDGTAGWNLTLNAAYKQAGGQTILDIDKTANSRTVFEYHVIKNSGGTNEVWLKRLYSEGKTSLGFYKEYDLGNYSQADYTTAHGLGRLPAFVQLYLRFDSSEFGFTTGQRYDMAYSGTDDNQRKVGIYMDTTNVIVDAPASNVAIQRADSINMVGISSFSVAPNLILRIYE